MDRKFFAKRDTLDRPSSKQAGERRKQRSHHQETVGLNNRLTLRLARADQLNQSLAHNLADLEPRLLQGGTEGLGKLWSEGLTEVNRVSTKAWQQGPHLQTQHEK